MRVSVVIPAYNAERYIAGCLRSLEEQATAPDEIILVSDGSNDKTSEIAMSFKGVRVVNHSTNRGIAAARNTGVRNSIGEVIAFIDSDCAAREDWLGKIKRDYADPRIGGVGGRGVETVRRTASDEFRSKYCRQDHGSEKKFVDSLFGLNFSFRRDVITEAGEFNEFFRTNGEDVEFSVRVAKMGGLLLYDPDVVVFHLKRDTLFSLLRTVKRSFVFGYLGRIVGEDRRVSVGRLMGRAILEIFVQFKRYLFTDLHRGSARLTVIQFLSISAEFLAIMEAFAVIKRKPWLTFSRRSRKPD